MDLRTYRSLHRAAVRLLREALAVGADTIWGAQDGWSLLRQGKKLFHIPLEVRSQKHLLRWLYAQAYSAEADLQEQILLRDGTNLLFARIERAPENGLVALTAVGAETFAIALARLGFLDGHAGLAAQLLGSPRGRLLIATPRSESIEQLTRLFIGLSGGVPSTVSDSTDEVAVQVVVAGNPCEALSMLAAEEREMVSGVVTADLLPRLCSRCTHWVAPAPNLCKRLPAEVQTTLSQVPVAAGCAECMGRGVQGTEVVATVLMIDEGVRTRLCTDPLGAGAFHCVAERATSSLFAAGLEKVRAGRHRIEDLLLQLPPEGSTGLPNTEAETLRRAVRQETVPRNEEDGATVLLVEDDKDQRHILATILRGSGYRVLEAADGREAYELLEAELPDVIVTDLMMPVMSGDELIQKVRAQSTLRKIPILVLTVIADQDRELHLLERGAQEYCLKTISPRLLLQRLHMVLSGKN